MYLLFVCVRLTERKDERERGRKRMTERGGAEHRSYDSYVLNGGFVWLVGRS